MADLDEISRSESVKIAGANPVTGLPDNWMEVDINGFIGTRLYNASGNALDSNYGTVSSTTLRVASQIGNTTGAADFAAGNSSAQTLRVVIASNQLAIPVTQSTSPWIVAGGGTAGTPGTAVLTIQGIAGGTAIPVSGTVTATNPSVSATGATPPTSATYMGGSVTTAAPTYTTGQMSALSLTTSGLLRVDGSGAVQPASQSGAWNITNITGTVSLPTGAATAANQATEIASLQLIDNAVGPVAPGTAAVNSYLIGGQFNTVLPTLTNTQQAAIQLDSSGRLIISPLTNASIVKSQLQDGSGTALTSTLIGIHQALDVNLVQTATDITATTTFNAAAQTLIATNTGGMSTWTVDLRAGGTGWTVGTNVIFEYSIDGVNYNTAYGIQLNALNGTPNNGASGPAAISFQGNIAGCATFRCRVFAYTGPDTVIVTIKLSAGSAVDALRMALPAGTNVIGGVTQSGAWNITNITGTITLPAGAATSANQATEISALTSIQSTSNSTAVNTNAIAANQTNGTQRTLVSDLVGNLQPSGDAAVRAISIKVTDGTNTAAVKAASTAPLATDPALVVSISPNSPVTQPTAANLNAQVVGNVASGATDSGNGVKIAIVANVNVASLPAVTDGQRVDAQGDLQGRIYVTNAPTDGARLSYSASIFGLVASATAPSDIFTITGSASKTIRVTRMAISGTQTTATQRDIFLVKRSSANAGGTSGTQTAVAHDSTNAAASAVVRAYTVNPTTMGTTVGTIAVQKVFIATTTTDSDLAFWEFGTRPSQAVVLRGVAETLAINLNGIVSAGSNLDIYVEWTEE